MRRHKIETLLRGAAFEPVSLDGLNAHSGLMERQERKYVAHRSQIEAIFSALAPRFYVLEHVGRRVFRYESVYFDDRYMTYGMHHQGKRCRFKVRSRLYADSGLCVFEMKVKRYRGCTDKRRIAYDEAARFSVTPEARTFMRQYYRDAYGEELPWDPKAVLDVVNDRVTFVSKDGGERVTIDFDLVFENHVGTYRAPPDCVIIETKTRSGHGFCDRLLSQHRLRPVRWCSKYCIGVAELGLVQKKNTFLPTMRIIHKHGEGTLLPPSEAFGRETGLAQ